MIIACINESCLGSVAFVTKKRPFHCTTSCRTINYACIYHCHIRKHLLLIGIPVSAFVSKNYFFSTGTWKHPLTTDVKIHTKCFVVQRNIYIQKSSCTFFPIFDGKWFLLVKNVQYSTSLSVSSMDIFVMFAKQSQIFNFCVWTSWTSKNAFDSSGILQIYLIEHKTYSSNYCRNKIWEVTIQLL